MKKGFSLIELLAVIIVLAIIALIATPIVLNVVEDAREASRKESVHGLIDATRLYINESILNPDWSLDKNLYDVIKNRVNGKIPDSGEIYVNGNNQIGIAVKLDKYCYYKNYTDDDITRSEDEDCTLSKLVDVCYDGQVVSSYDINKTNCLALISDWGYDETDKELFCTGQVASDGYSLEKAIEYEEWGEDSLNYLIDEGVLENIQYETKCMSCFETKPNIKLTYDIDKNKCIEFIKNIGASYEDESDYEKFCTKGQAASDGLSLENGIDDFRDNPLVSKLINEKVITNVGLNINYDIDKNKCIEFTKNIGAPYEDESDFEKFCTKGQMASDGVSLEMLIYSESFSLSHLKEAGVISNVSYEKEKITGYRCYADNPYKMPEITDIVIPEEISNKKVTAIGEEALANYSLTSVDISSASNIEYIEPYAFAGNLLTEVDLMGLTGIEELSGKIFANNENLETIKIPYNVTTIAENEFTNISNLQEIIIDNYKGTISGESWGANESTKITYLRKKTYAFNEVVSNLVLNENGECKTDGSTYEYMGGCYIKAEPSTTLANYIWYNGYLWRIMGINSDGTIRMMTEESITSISYDVSDNVFEGSNVDVWLNEYFYPEFTDNLIVEQQFCQRTFVDYYSPASKTCEDGTLITRKVALITMDEYKLSGNYFSYLQTDNNFWTMSSGSGSNFVNMASVHDKIGYSYGFADSTYIRPLINIRPDIMITGNGLADDYFEIVNSND